MSENQENNGLFFLSPDAAIFGLSIPLDEFAARSGFLIKTWEEHGLGQLRGVSLSLPSGAKVWVVESAHAIASLGAKGLDVMFEANDLQSKGRIPLLQEFFTAAQLHAREVDWISGHFLQKPSKGFIQGMEAVDIVTRVLNKAPSASPSALPSPT